MRDPSDTVGIGGDLGTRAIAGPAQMTNRDPSVHSLWLLSRCAPLVLFVFVLLIIAGRMITGRGAPRSGRT
jgi:hypothetical protein